jgi:Tfp pilus assembly protein PilN
MRAVNLIPVDQRGGGGLAAGRSQGGAYAVLALVAVLALFTFLYGSARHAISSRRAQAASIAAQTQQAQALAAQLTAYTSFLSLREQRVQAVSQLAQSRFDWARAFHELGRVLPHEASVNSLAGTIGSQTSTAGSTTAATSSTAVTSATPPGSIPIFTVSGCATTQTQVAQTLNRLRLIEGVKDVSLQSSTQSVGSSGSSATGGCPAKAASFTAVITFAPLPAVSSSSATTTTASTSPSSGGAGG